MSFASMMESSERGELLLVDGGLCRWHRRKDGQITIYEIISQHAGVGKLMLSILKDVEGAQALVARCPVEYPANAWWQRNGFALERQEVTRTGKGVNVWRMRLC